ncbi:hypothetical protein HDA32_005714 [Spinactinospora alkalitolerans]|uniref:ATP-grasp domain-containing protein n=1 Tax=Spinactinospora alkalitolerans TaxID=687207 RepID=A0A852U907_9ACTN|nr:ATP-grasp domain-containing protein [Spinactinospora alkalitolerans]NYE50594.1 hypothetical protein [Spinactinospora alkalitolerans]
MADASYTEAVKEALVGDRDAEFVWLCNFEVEHEWARGFPGLPSAQASATASIVQRMEEFGALLAAPGDHLLLGSALDPGYRAYLGRTVSPPPGEIVVDGADTARAVLSSPAAINRLRALADRGAYLMPMGVSRNEEEITTATGLKLAAPDADTAQRVNSKIYSRRLVEELGLRGIPGHTCETVEELRNALRPLPTPESPLIVKDAYGMSGKGLLVLDSPRRAEGLLRMVERRAQRTGDPSIHVVVEEFLDKRFDLNYQFTVDRTGRVRLDFVKRALTSGGVHQGHVIPAGLSCGHIEEIGTVAEHLGNRLFADGFFGIVGVDALLSDDGLLYPVLEINARLNMSSYQGRVLERFHRPPAVALAKHYTLRLRRTVGFEEVLHELGDLAAPPTGGSGLVVTCFGTLNAARAEIERAGTREGRLYTVLIAPDDARLRELDGRVADRLGRLTTKEASV